MKPSLVPYMLLQSMKVHQFSRIRNLLPNPTCIAGSHSTPQCKTLPSPTPIITPHTYEGHTGGSVFPCSLVPPKPLGDPQYTSLPSCILKRFLACIHEKLRTTALIAKFVLEDEKLVRCM